MLYHKVNLVDDEDGVRVDVHSTEFCHESKGYRSPKKKALQESLYEVRRRKIRIEDERTQAKLRVLKAQAELAQCESHFATFSKYESDLVLEISKIENGFG